MDHTWSMVEEAGSWFALGPVQQGFLKGQGDLNRKRLDKSLGGCPQCTTRKAEANPRAKKWTPGNPGTHENAQEESTSFDHLSGPGHKRSGDHGTLTCLPPSLSLGEFKHGFGKRERI